MTGEHIRERELIFAIPHRDVDLPASAILVLGEIPAVRHTMVTGDCSLHLSYDVREICFADVEECLACHGLHLDNSILFRLRRAYFHYTDDTARTNLGIRPGGTTTNLREVFRNDFDRARHGCRDNRPHSWRDYL